MISIRFGEFESPGKGSHPSREGKPKSMSKGDELLRPTYERGFIHFTLSKSISRSGTILICAAAAFTFERESACSDRSTVWGALICSLVDIWTIQYYDSGSVEFQFMKRRCEDIHSI